jgi:hypothetical protein
MSTAEVPFVDDRMIARSSDHMLVLYDLVVRLNEEDRVQFVDQAEQRALWDLESGLERELADVLSADYQERVRGARARLRDAATDA